ncbi:MAG TPA: thiopeptide-type bacteriocin biosynthesis protein [Allosphingosinicella sp.]|nr:thiopeptide-type bacteriocin biosynthesis protein [Allosphingosinicella sp.]
MAGSKTPFSDREAESVRVAGFDVDFEALAAHCATGSRDGLPDAIPQAALDAIRSRFLRAGRDSLRAMADGAGWLQLSISPQGMAAAALYEEIGSLFDHALETGDAAEAFFMHKPPGLRLRLQSNSIGGEACRGLLSAAAGRWTKAGFIAAAGFETYEPEQGLFGGRAAMAHVHRLFTADSRFWLAQHSRRVSPTERLMAALALLRRLYVSLGIIDWEDIDVWEKVRDRTGRAVPDEARLDAGVKRSVYDSFVEAWAAPDRACATMDPAIRSDVATLSERFAKLGPGWRSCLQRDQPYPSPRAAAALYTIFFLNRADISIERQRLVADALASRSTVD